MAGIVYLIELERPLPGKKQSRFYLGSTNDLARRLEQHRTGKGSPMLKRAAELGIGYKRIYWKQYQDERRARRLEAQLKRRKHNVRALKRLKQLKALVLQEAKPTTPTWEGF